MLTRAPRVCRETGSLPWPYAELLKKERTKPAEFLNILRETFNRPIL